MFNLISICLAMFLLGSPLCGVLCASWLEAQRIVHNCAQTKIAQEIGYFLVGEIYNYTLFKNILIHFLSLLFFWEVYNSNVGTFAIVIEATEIILSCFYSFSFILQKIIPLFYIPVH